MTTAYIKLQLNHIAVTVEKVLTLPAAAQNIVAQNSVPSFQLDSTSLKQHSMSIMHLRHHVVRRVTGIRDLLETERIHTISIHKGANALNELSAGLKLLGMNDESILVGKWAIVVVRLLVDASGGGQPDLCATLALHLLRQSIRYYEITNNIQSLQAIEEAYTIAQNLRNHGGKANFQILYSNILTQYALLVDNQRSIELSVEAVQVLEDILHVQAFTQSTLHGKIQRSLQSNSFVLDLLFSTTPSIPAIISYALALHRLGAYLFIDGHPEIALDLELLAITVRRKMVSMHGHEYKVYLAWSLLCLVEHKIASRIPAEEVLDMADECIKLFRELAEKNPLYYARELVNVLWEKACILRKLNRDDEAIIMWKEVASLAEQIVQDSQLCAKALVQLRYDFHRLKRHEDAVRTGTLAITTYQERAEIQAARHWYLANDLEQLRRYKDSSEAVRTSIALYQSLAMKDPAIWMGRLTESLSYLAHSLAASGNYSEAMIAWKESVIVLDNILNANPDATSDLIDCHLPALDRYTCISCSLENEDECLKVALTAVQYFCRLSEIDVQKTSINWRFQWLQAELWYAYNMHRFGRLQDAQQYIDHCFDVWSIKPEGIPVLWHAVMMNLKVDVLDAQGCTKEALLIAQKVHNIVKLSVSSNQSFVHERIESMVREARLRGNLGDTEVALQVAERALRLSRDNKSDPIITSLTWALYGVALTALLCRHYKRAVEAAQEGCNMFASSHWQNNKGEHDIFIGPSLLTILSSAEANLGRYSTAVACAYRAVDEALEIGDDKLWISSTTAGQSYMETRGNLAEILLATGDLVQVRQICEERRAYFSKRVEKGMGEYRDLAPILRMLGVLSCSEGRHEEGDAAAKELSRIIKMLGSVFPSLQEQVKVRLRHQAKVPILKVLDDMSQKLECGHQAEIVLLFAI